MTREMFDSVTVADLPRHGEMFAAYNDGHYTNADAVRKRFPKALVVTITVNGTTDADVCDCETGDLTPGSAATWARRQVNNGRHPTIYCNASTWPAVKTAVTKAGIKGKVNYWIAHYDGVAEVPKGAVAKQYLGSPGNSPGHYDVSVVADYWPGVDKPQPAKAVRFGPIRTRVFARLTAQLKAGRRPDAHAQQVTEKFAAAYQVVIHGKGKK